MPRVARRFVALVRPPRGPAWIELAGADGESAESVDARAQQAMRELCAPYPSYAIVDVLTYDGAKRAYPREMRHFEACAEREQARAALHGEHD